MDKKILYLTQMGCDFRANDKLSVLSDCGGHRLETRSGLITGKDGNEYFLSFTTWSKWTERKTNKRNGQPLRKPVIEIVLENALHINTEYENKDGSWRNCKLEAEIDALNLTYNKDDILTAVNYISSDIYTQIEIIK